MGGPAPGIDTFKARTLQVASCPFPRSTPCRITCSLVVMLTSFPPPILPPMKRCEADQEGFTPRVGRLKRRETDGNVSKGGRRWRFSSAVLSTAQPPVQTREMTEQ